MTQSIFHHQLMCLPGRLHGFQRGEPPFRELVIYGQPLLGRKEHPSPARALEQAVHICRSSAQLKCVQHLGPTWWKVAMQNCLVHDMCYEWWYVQYGYGSIPINTIFSGMNIHLPAILMFTRGTRFWHTAICIMMYDMCVDAIYPVYIYK